MVAQRVHALRDAPSPGIGVAKCRCTADAGRGVTRNTDGLVDLLPSQGRLCSGRFFRFCRGDLSSGHGDKNAQDEHESLEKLLVHNMCPI
ncbi:MAG: hypothetical protein JW384_04137 [Nitrosomonadaceae bacterium]|nr:hypothetical protein [Nitrosomonadaceae bacterium]